MNLTDLGNAERLIERYGKELRFCHSWGKFLFWDGKRRVTDENGATERRAKETVRSMYKFASKFKDKDKRGSLALWAVKSESYSRLNAMIRLAQSEPGVPVAVDQLDADPWLFNCMDGTINIRTGNLLAHSPDHLITKIVPWGWDNKAQCPKWREHLDLIMHGNKNLISFLQRAWGSCLTGITDDRKIFFAWGTGKNGKSICQETIAMILGDYAMRTPVETLLLKRGEQIPNDLARLKGARFVYTSESESGRRLSESLVKDFTSGEKITARFLHREWFEFHPTFKIFLSTNHKPVIKGTDEAIWDRIALIPFTVRIPDDKQKPRHEILGEFQKEAAGILGWLVIGAYEWHHNGLNPPAEVQAAVKSYREEMDVLGDFFDSKCVFERKTKVKSSSLYEAYTEWAQKNAEGVLSKTMFGKMLRERGCEAIRGSGGIRMWLGIGLKPDTWQ